MDNTDQLVIVPVKNLAKLGVMNIFKKYRFEIYEMNHKKYSHKNTFFKRFFLPNEQCSDSYASEPSSLKEQKSRTRGFATRLIVNRPFSKIP